MGTSEQRLLASFEPSDDPPKPGMFGARMQKTSRCQYGIPKEKVEKCDRLPDVSQSRCFTLLVLCTKCLL